MINDERRVTVTDMQGSKELREKLAIACRLLYMEGLMDHAGLAGARIPETGNLLL